MTPRSFENLSHQDSLSERLKPVDVEPLDVQIKEVIDKAESVSDRATLKALLSIDAKVSAALNNQVILADGHDDLRALVRNLTDEVKSLGAVASNNIGRITVIEDWVADKRLEELKTATARSRSEGYHQGVRVTVAKVATVLAVAVSALVGIFKLIIAHFFANQ